MEEIKNWLKSQKFSLEAKSCFDESFVCFHAGAYKAALLFAYLGFMNVLRDRILSSSVPTGYQQGHWESLQRTIRAEETWDSAIFQTTQQKSPAPIFIVSDDLRDQVKYWKDRRNDCAHSKDNLITSSYVETLYSFIRSNINKFVVNGNRDSMLQRILDHYDLGLTPPDQPLEPLIHDLPNAVSATNLETFLGELFTQFDQSRNQSEQMLGVPSANKLQFINACFQYGSDHLKNVCKRILYLDDVLVHSFLKNYPDKSIVLSDAPDRVRRLWHDRLFESLLFSDDFPILASLLRNNLIPEGQIEEMFNHILGKGIQELPNDIDNRILIEKGFYRCLEAVLQEKISDFDWSRNSKHLIIKYLTDFPISLEVARKLYSEFNGEFFPWRLADSLNNFFLANNAKKQEFLNIKGQHPEIGFPERIPSLRED